MKVWSWTLSREKGHRSYDNRLRSTMKDVTTEIQTFTLRTPTTFSIILQSQLSEQKYENKTL